MVNLINFDYISRWFSQKIELSKNNQSILTQQEGNMYNFIF